MTQVKAKLDRDAEGEAPLLDANLDDSATPVAPSTPSGKSKKKKKKAKKKNTLAELDLDMDNDDAAEQTRFAGMVKTPQNEEQKSAAEANASPSNRGQARRSTKAQSKAVVAGLMELAEVDEDEDSDEEQKQQ